MYPESLTLWRNERRYHICTGIDCSICQQFRHPFVERLMQAVRRILQ